MVEKAHRPQIVFDAHAHFSATDIFDQGALGRCCAQDFQGCRWRTLRRFERAFHRIAGKHRQLHALQSGQQGQGRQFAARPQQRKAGGTECEAQSVTGRQSDTHLIQAQRDVHWLARHRQRQLGEVVAQVEVQHAIGELADLTIRRDGVESGDQLSTGGVAAQAQLQAHIPQQRQRFGQRLRVEAQGLRIVAALVGWAIGAEPDRAVFALMQAGGQR